MTDDLVGRLREQGARMAEASKKMAQAKSLRNSNGQHDDLYFSQPAEDTIEYRAAARIEALEAALRALIATYDGMETGDGEPCPDIAAARQLFPKDNPHAD